MFARRSTSITSFMRFRYGSPLRSHTEVKLAVYLDKSRCVNRFCNKKCSLVTTLHCTQIFSSSEKFSSSVPFRSFVAPLHEGNFSREKTSHKTDVMCNHFFNNLMICREIFKIRNENLIFPL